MLVAVGILSSRLVGFVRTSLFANILGVSPAAGAFNAAFRIPNLLQNLFGEGVLSASFIPTYAGLLARGDEEEADRVAGAVFGLLALSMSVLVLLGMVFAPQIVHLVISEKGFRPESVALTIRLVRIFFPSTGLLVGSAWCLGVLNSHRRFLLSYASPVLWNLVQIGALVAFRHGYDEAHLAILVGYSVVVGSAVQFAVQLPRVMGLLGHFWPSLDVMRASVQQVLRGLAPVLLSRGVVQLSAYVDAYYASSISESISATMAYAQVIYLLPVSLFGMAVSAAELPEMSGAQGTLEEIAATLRARINRGLTRIAFFVIPSVAALLLLGDVVGGVLYQRGTHFLPQHTRLLWYVLAGSAVGLLAATFGRLYSSAFYALKDTRTPLYFAVLRVVLTAVTAYVSVNQVPRWLGLPQDLGAVGITATTGLAAWVEFALLRRALGRRIGPTGLPRGRGVVLWSCALVGAAVGLGIKGALVRRFGVAPGLEAVFGGLLLPAPRLSTLWTAGAVLLPFGGIYLTLTFLLGVSPLDGPIRRVLRLPQKGS